ncbi:PilN domain-containing protein [Spiribacter salinus]|uniref:PilN domain-containing protein n=1 Tax=Spiribacter salinus TaxID=1335746 RepID=UPI001C967694|nr:PilN domain-containing protein [Spiribacter salinus]MBY5269300.1 hypothetical protein [Spiribacter salinus]
MPTGVNLLDWRARHDRRLKRRFLMQMMTLAGIGLAVMFMATRALEGQINAERARHNPLAREIDAGATALVELDRLEIAVSALEDHLAAIETLEATRHARFSAIETALSARPGPVGLDRLSSTDKGLTITGKTGSSDALTAYTRALTASKTFTSARITTLHSGSARSTTHRHFELVAEAQWR